MRFCSHDSRGAVGEVLISPYDLDGRFLGEALRDRVIAYDARELPRVPIALGVGGGPSKIRPILGALRAGVVNVLVTDIRTAEAVVDLDDQTRSAESGQRGATARSSASAPGA